MSPRLVVRFSRRATDEIEAVDRWWAIHRPAALGAIARELANALELVARHPSAGAVAASVRLRGVRRVSLLRIGYHLYYRVERDHIDVLAFWHMSRGTDPRI